MPGEGSNTRQAGVRFRSQQQGSLWCLRKKGRFDDGLLLRYIFIPLSLSHMHLSSHPLIPPLCHSSVRLSVCPPAHLLIFASIHPPAHPSSHTPILPYTFPPTHFPAHPSIHSIVFCASIHIPLTLTSFLFVRPPSHLPSHSLSGLYAHHPCSHPPAGYSVTGCMG